MLGGVAIGGWWLWRFIHDDLPSLVAESLSETLSRPVEVGPLQSISFTNIRFGPSALPATPTDADRATTKAVDAHFDPLQVVWDRTLELDVTLVGLDGYLQQDEDLRWTTTQIKQGGEPGPIDIKLKTLRVRDGTVVLAPYGKRVQATSQQPVPNPAPANATPPQGAAIPGTRRATLTLQNLNGAVTFLDNNQRIAFEATSNLDTGGALRVKGTSNLSTTASEIQLKANDLLAADLGLLLVPYSVPAALKTGQLSADLRMQFQPDQPARLFGTAQIRNVNAQIENVPKLVTGINGRLGFQDRQITFQTLRGRYGEVNAQVLGSLDLQKGYNLTVQVLPTSVADIAKTAGTTLPIAASGAIKAEAKVTGALDRPVITGSVTNTQPLQVDRLNLRSAQARFVLNQQTLTVNQVRGELAAGGVVTGDGVVKLGQPGGVVFDVQANNLAGDAIAQAYGASTANVTIGNVDATAQVYGTFDNLQTSVQWQAPQASYPARGKILIAGDTIRFEDTLLLVAGGIVRGRGSIAQGRWQAFLNSSGVELSQFSDQLRGLFSGEFQLAGSLADLRPEAIQAQGRVRLSEGVSALRGPLEASVRWLGDRLQIQQATAPGFNASGVVVAQLQGTPGIRNVDLNVQLQDYDLAALPVSLPPQVQVRGQANFNGRVTGPLDAIRVAGQLGLNDFAVNQFAFEPLAGNVQYALNRGLDLNLTGNQDRIAVTLDARNRPLAFYVQQGQTIAQGKGSGDRLLATLENFPLAALNLSPAAGLGLGAVEGNLNGRFDINLANLNNPAVLGEVAIANPGLGYITADSFTGRFRYLNGAATLEGAKLERGASRYLISGTYDPQAETVFQGKVVADPGRVEDITAALQWFELSDIGRGIQTPTYAGAADVATVPVGLPGASLLEQLRRYSEVTTLYRQQVQQAQDQSIIPQLTQLQGQFTGTVNIAFSPQTGPSVDFGLAGQNWTWGQYQVNQVLAQGSFKDGIVTLLPLRLQSNDSFLNFAGQVGGEQQTGQLRAENIPVAALRDLLKLPVDITGNLDANATLSGSVGNPQVIGELLLADGQVRGATVPEVRTLFGYSNARLNFDGRVVETVDDDQFQVTGSLPYRFPFMTVSPDSNALSLDVNVRNNGLALLNLFTDQVAWKGGEAAVNLQARGTLDTEPQTRLTLVATGNATLNNATIGAQALPEDLKNVSGQIAFNNDRIIVQSLQGAFSKGEVTAQGVLPLIRPFSTNDQDVGNPLTVSLNNLNLDLKNQQQQNQYIGNINGQVVLTGTAFSPVIGGDILLSNGRVFLPDTSQAPVAAAAPAEPVPAGPGVVSPVRFDDLMLQLGNNVRIISQPVLSFVAMGDLAINGTLDDLRPSGTIRLREGQVNLFATQFFLARGYQNTAVFTPARGLDPVLNVRLVTSVSEVTRAPAPSNSPFAAAEIAETPASSYGELRTVRVQATVSGPASQINNNLELTSTPARSESEIIALIGGSFVNTLGQGNATTTLAALAGTTVLGDLQAIVNNATGGRATFRLFTTSVATQNADRTSVLALAAELGLDITNNLTVSIIPLLTVDEPTLFGISYRINDQLSLRGSTDFSGESRAAIEFETRF